MGLSISNSIDSSCISTGTLTTSGITLGPRPDTATITTTNPYYVKIPDIHHGTISAA